jgi:hypothetical protein
MYVPMQKIPSGVAAGMGCAVIGAAAVTADTRQGTNRSRFMRI